MSLFTDTASEMLYPVLPIYLQSIGFSILLIGILEGIAEATAGLSKGYFGQLSDIRSKRTPFVQIGYALSAVSKPMMAFSIFPLWILFARTVDRLGKGIRTGARDAMLSDEATPATKGKIFGFHRSMDTLGAVLGPALALLYLYRYPNNYIHLFYIAFIPGLLAIISTIYLKEKRTNIVERKIKITFFSFLNYWKSSPDSYRKVVVGIIFFALFNSSDVFLLLKAKEAGLSDPMVIGFYIFYNLVFAIFAFPLGSLSDSLGFKKVFLFGIAIFSMVYFAIGLFSNLYIIIGLFFLYGIYAAATEGVSKAWISSLVEEEKMATAIGTFTAFQSLAALVASTLAGFLWCNFGSGATFLTTAAASVLVIFYFLFSTATSRHS